MGGIVVSETLLALINEQNRHCFYCDKVFFYIKGHDLRPTIDHRVPKCRGGKEGENLVAACFRCNSLKGDTDEETFRQLMHDIPRLKTVKMRALHPEQFAPKPPKPAKPRRAPRYFIKYAMGPQEGRYGNPQTGWEWPT